MTSADLWHIVEAKREDGAPAIFRIREIEPRLTLPRIFVIEWPYPIIEESRLPNAAAYRKLATFEEQWLIPACDALGWCFVGSKTEDGSFFLYVYGDGDPKHMIERLSPFDATLAFFDDDDPDWEEYNELTILLERAKAIPKSSLTGEAASRKAKPASSQRRGRKPARTRVTATKKAPSKLAARSGRATRRPKPKATAKAKPTRKGRG